MVHASGDMAVLLQPQQSRGQPIQVGPGMHGPAIACAAAGGVRVLCPSCVKTFLIQTGVAHASDQDLQLFVEVDVHVPKLC